jgi:hypothetical protein
LVKDFDFLTGEKPKRKIQVKTFETAVRLGQVKTEKTAPKNIQNSKDKTQTNSQKR